ncbi:GTPase [Chloroflexota bacterium]
MGLPNVGKSQLLSRITEAHTEVADYPFTTRTPLPGMMKFENIQIQIVDTPPIIDRNAHSWFHVILRNADLSLIMVDLGNEPLGQAQTIFEELGKLRIRPVGGGAREDSEETVIRQKALIIGNKSDVDGSSQNYQRLERRYAGEFPVISLSAKEGVGLNELKREIYKALDIIRVYTKALGGKPDFSDPIILKMESTVEDAAESIHKDLRHELKYAQIWGSGKFSGQRVSRQYIPEDGDIIEIHI